MIQELKILNLYRSDLKKEYETDNLLGFNAEEMLSESAYSRYLDNHIVAIHDYDGTVYVIKNRLGKTTVVSESEWVRFKIKIGFDMSIVIAEMEDDRINRKPLLPLEDILTNVSRILNDTGHHLLNTQVKRHLDKLKSEKEE